MRQGKTIHNGLNRIIAAGTVCVFLLNSIPCIDEAFALAPWAGTQKIAVRREAVRLALELRDRLIYAESEDAKKLLESNEADALLLSHGKILVSEEVAGDDLKLLRKIIHEEIEAVMQIIAKEDQGKYAGIRDRILNIPRIRKAYYALLPKNEKPPLPWEIILNDLIAKAFEIIALKEQGLLLESEITPEEKYFIDAIKPVIYKSKLNYFTGEFWDSNVREMKIRAALANGQTFHQVKSDIPAEGETGIIISNSEQKKKRVLGKRLEEILESGKAPLMSIDMGNTLIMDRETLENRKDIMYAVIGFLEKGGFIAFNTLDTKDEFYHVVLEALANELYRTNKSHLMNHIYMLFRGGREIFQYDSEARCYRQIYHAGYGTKADGALWLLDKHLKDKASLLALYADEFYRYLNDGNAIGMENIPVIVNAGENLYADSVKRIVKTNIREKIYKKVTDSQYIFNTNYGGPERVRQDLSWITGELPEDVPFKALPGAAAEPEKPEIEWTFDKGRSFTALKECRVKVVVGKPGEGAPGFIWAGVKDEYGTWNPDKIYLIPLILNSDGQHEAVLPKGVNHYTFFWTGGEDAKSGFMPGHWEKGKAITIDYVSINVLPEELVSLDEDERQAYGQRIDDIADIYKAVDECMLRDFAHQPYNAGNIAIQAMGYGIEGITKKYVIDAVLQCMWDTMWGKAYDLMGKAIEHKVEGLTLDELLYCVYETPNKNNAHADNTGDLVLKALENNLDGTTIRHVEDTLSLVLSTQNPLYLAGKITLAAVKAKVEGLTQGHIDYWIGLQKKNPYYNAMIKIEAERAGLRDLRSGEIKKAMDECVKRKEYGDAVKIAREAIKDNGIDGITVEDMKDIINKGFHGYHPSASYGVAIQAREVVEEGIDGIRLEDVDEWIWSSIRSLNPHEAGRLAVAAISKKIDGITEGKIVEWMYRFKDNIKTVSRNPRERKTLDIAIYYAQKIALEAMLTGVEGVTIELVRENFTTAYNHDPVRCTIDSIAVNAVKAGVEGITVDDVKKNIDYYFRTEQIDIAWATTMELIRTQNKEVTYEDAEKWALEFRRLLPSHMREGWMEIIIEAFRADLEGAAYEKAKEWAERFFNWNEAYRAGQMAVEAARIGPAPVTEAIEELIQNIRNLKLAKYAVEPTLRLIGFGVSKGKYKKLSKLISPRLWIDGFLQAFFFRNLERLIGRVEAMKKIFRRPQVFSKSQTMDEFLHNMNVGIDEVADSMALDSIDFRDSGRTESNFAEIAETFLDIGPDFEPETLPEPPPKYEDVDLKDVPEYKDIEDILDDYEFVRPQGRTLIYRRRYDKKLLALKLLKKETIPRPGLLYQEAKFLSYINEYRWEMRLNGTYPQPVEVDGNPVIRVDTLPADALKALTQQETDNGEKIAVDHTDNKYTLMMYEVESEEYFTYINSEGVYETQFLDALNNNLHDLFVLARHGIVHTALVDLFHNLDTEGRTDRGRYLWNADLVHHTRRFGGAGRLHDWLGAVRYPNMRLSGIADFEEMRLLSEVIDPENPVSDHLSGINNGTIQNLKNFYLQSYTGNYLLAAALVVGSRYRMKDDLDWEHPDNIGKIMIRAFMGASESFQGFITEKMEKALLTIDWGMLARQMSFFMSDDYVEYLNPSLGDKRKLPYEMFLKSTNVMFGDYRDETWDDDIGWMGLLANGNSDGMSALGPINGPNPLQELIRAIYVTTTFMIDKSDEEEESPDTAIPRKGNPAIGRIGTDSIEKLAAVAQVNRHDNYPEEWMREVFEDAKQNFGILENKPEMYRPEFSDLLNDKIGQFIPDEVMTLLNGLKPYDDRWEDFPEENERSKRFQDGYDNNTVGSDIRKALDTITGTDKFFEFVQFPAIYYDDYDYIFGFNSTVIEELQDIFKNPTIGLCKELVNYLQYLDDQNSMKDIKTNLYLEALIHEVLHSKFTHEEARVIARYLFPENYPAEEEGKEKGGLLNAAITNLRNIETAIGYITRPRRTQWPADRHAARGLISRAISESDFSYTPFYKKMVKAILLFAFTPDHPDLFMPDIGRWFKHLKATDDLVLATLWGLGNPEELETSDNFRPYLEDDAKGLDYFSDLRFKRNFSWSDDNADKHFTPEERANILLTSIKFAQREHWEFFTSGYSIKANMYAPIRLLPYMIISNEDLIPILLELSKILKKDLYESQGEPRKSELERAEIILKSLIKLTETKQKACFPDELMQTITDISRDTREDIKKRLGQLAVDVIVEDYTPENRISTTRVNYHDRQHIVDDILCKHPELSYAPERLHEYVQRHYPEITDGSSLNVLAGMVTNLYTHFTTLESMKLLFEYGFYGEIDSVGGSFNGGVASTSYHGDWMWVSEIVKKGGVPWILAFRTPKSLMSVSFDDDDGRHAVTAPAKKTRVDSIPQELLKELEKKNIKGMVTNKPAEFLKKITREGKLGHISADYIDIENSIWMNEMYFGDAFKGSDCERFLLEMKRRQDEERGLHKAPDFSDTGTLRTLSKTIHKNPLLVMEGLTAESADDLTAKLSASLQTGEVRVEVYDFKEIAALDERAKFDSRLKKDYYESEKEPANYVIIRNAVWKDADVSPEEAYNIFITAKRCSNELSHDDIRQHIIIIVEQDQDLDTSILLPRLKESMDHSGYKYAYYDDNNVLQTRPYCLGAPERIEGKLAKARQKYLERQKKAGVTQDKASDDNIPERRAKWTVPKYHEFEESINASLTPEEIEWLIDIRMKYDVFDIGVEEELINMFDQHLLKLPEDIRAGIIRLMHPDAENIEPFNITSACILLEKHVGEVKDYRVVAEALELGLKFNTLQMLTTKKEIITAAREYLENIQTADSYTQINLTMIVEEEENREKVFHTRSRQMAEKLASITDKAPFARTMAILPEDIAREVDVVCDEYDIYSKRLELEDVFAIEQRFMTKFGKERLDEIPLDGMFASFAIANIILGRAFLATTTLDDEEKAIASYLMEKVSGYDKSGRRALAFEDDILKYYYAMCMMDEQKGLSRQEALSKIQAISGKIHELVKKLQEDFYILDHEIVDEHFIFEYMDRDMGFTFRERSDMDDEPEMLEMDFRKTIHLVCMLYENAEEEGWTEVFEERLRVFLDLYNFTTEKNERIERLEFDALVGVLHEKGSYDDITVKAFQAIKKYQETGQSLILNADDILKHAVVLDLKDTVGNLLARNNVLKGGKIFIFTKENKANAAIIEQMIHEADPELKTVIVMRQDLIDRNMITGESDTEEAEAIIKLARAEAGNNILAFIQGPTKEPEEMEALARDKKIPFIIVGLEKAYYSLARAVAEAMKILNENEGWFHILDPMGPISEKLLDRYDQARKALISA